MDPVTTGDVLRTASEHVRQYGWRQQAFGTRQTGMCLHGGIYSAVAEHNGIELPESIISRKGFDLADVPWVNGTHEQESQRLYMQGDDAVVALAPLIPSCGCTGVEGASQTGVVYHYNDVHCTGGEDAALLLEQAAEKWEANRG